MLDVLFKAFFLKSYSHRSEQQPLTLSTPWHPSLLANAQGEFVILGSCVALEDVMCWYTLTFLWQSHQSMASSALSLELLPAPLPSSFPVPLQKSYSSFLRRPFSPSLSAQQDRIPFFYSWAPWFKLPSHPVFCFLILQINLSEHPSLPTPILGYFVQFPFNLISILQVFPVLPPLTSHCSLLAPPGPVFLPHSLVCVPQVPASCLKVCFCAPLLSAFWQVSFGSVSPALPLSVPRKGRAVDDGVAAVGPVGPTGTVHGLQGEHSHRGASGHSAADIQACFSPRLSDISYISIALACSWHKRYPFIYSRFNLHVRLIQIL